MTPQKPYLVRAIFEWLLDNQSTPYLLVKTDQDGVQVPEAYIRDHRIVLNIAPDAVRDLLIDNEWISFSARFAGKPMEVFVPIAAVQAIYSKENNEGMFFPEDDMPPPSPPSDNDDDPDDPPPGGGDKRPSLRVVK